jgi:hypothetical protein
MFLLRLHRAQVSSALAGSFPRDPQQIPSAPRSFFEAPCFIPSDAPIVPVMAIGSDLWDAFALQ